MFRLCLTAVLVAAFALALGACKGKTKYKDDPETTQKLTDCEKNLKEKEAYIATLEKRLADGAGALVTVSIEGEAMKISGKGPHESTDGEKGNAADAKLYEAFVASLRKSRGSIQKCYQNALKNNATLQARSVTLNIEVQYKTSGSVTEARFSPRIDPGFDRCMNSVARRWTLPAMPRAVAFNYKQTLTPE
jgi:hypothetical protein